MVVYMTYRLLHWSYVRNFFSRLVPSKTFLCLLIICRVDSGISLTLNFETCAAGVCIDPILKTSNYSAGVLLRSATLPFCNVDFGLR